ncbi:SLAM family member 8-like [Salminus brasiliensis]|uniref:SLAM family member 8-like n=1 Tax=Salminus brasiliensis TaxID=930266 RepID=UPI003B831495
MTTSLLRYRVSSCRAVLLVLCYGLSVLAEESTVRRAAGSSLILPLGYPKESVSYVQWKYEGSTFASYRNGQIRITNELQFSGRLKVDNENLSVELTDLQLRDSGRYSITADKTGDQLPTKTTSLTVYGLLKMEIESSQTWKQSTNSCEVHLVCRAPKDQTVSYRWSGYKMESGDQLNFTLTPADGDVTLNCTASSSLGNGSNTTIVKCRPKESPTGESISGAPLSVLSLLSSLMAASPFLLVSIILGVKCYRARAKPAEVNRIWAVREAGEADE